MDNKERTEAAREARLIHSAKRKERTEDKMAAARTAKAAKRLEGPSERGEQTPKKSMPEKEEEETPKTKKIRMLSKYGAQQTVERQRITRQLSIAQKEGAFLRRVQGNLRHALHQATEQLIAHEEALSKKVKQMKIAEYMKKYRRQKKKKMFHLKRRGKSRWTLQRTINNVLGQIAGFDEEAGKKILKKAAKRKGLIQFCRQLDSAKTYIALRRLHFEDQRRLRSVLKKVHCPIFSSERKVREFLKELLEEQTMVTTEMMLKKDGKEEKILVTMAEKPAQTIDALIRMRIANGTWQETNDFGEVWISIMGDSGGNVFKLVCLLGNRTGPINSIENCLLLCAFEADESGANIRKACGNIASEITKLVEDMGMRLFLCGDYKILKIFSGTKQGRPKFPCIYCNQPRDQEPTYAIEDFPGMVAARNHEEPPDLEAEQLFKDFDREQYLPPLLHITMKIGTEFLDRMEKAVFVMDGAQISVEVFKMCGAKELARLENLAEQMADIVQVLAEMDLLEEGRHAEHAYSQLAPEEEECFADCLALRGPIPKRKEAADYITCGRCKNWYHTLCIGLDKDEIKRNWQCFRCKKSPEQQQQNVIEEILEGERKLWEAEMRRLSEIEDEIKANVAEEIIKMQRNLGPLSLKLFTSIEAVGATKRAFFQKYTGSHIQKICVRTDRLEKLLPAEVLANTTVRGCIDGLKLLGVVHGHFSPKFMSEKQRHDFEGDLLALLVHIQKNFPTMRPGQKGHIFFRHCSDFADNFHTIGYFNEQAIEACHAEYNKQSRRMKTRSIKIKQEWLMRKNWELCFGATFE